MARKKKADEDALNDLHKIVAEYLTKQINGGATDAATVGAAIRFLKDNGISSVAVRGTPLGDLLDSMNPEECSDEDYERVRREAQRSGGGG